MVADLVDESKKVPVKFRLGTIMTLHSKFESECDTCVSVEIFRINIPFNVIKPNPNDWGTCLCGMCINPELKLDALADTTQDKTFKWTDDKDYNEIDDLLERVKALAISKQAVIYNEWQIVKIRKIVKGRLVESKVSRKVPVKESMKVFKLKLIKDLERLKDHLQRVHSQFKAFKEARLEAETNPEVVTLQADWSENKKLSQSGEEKSAYYYEDHISLHPVRV